MLVNVMAASKQNLIRDIVLLLHVALLNAIQGKHSTT